MKKQNINELFSELIGCISTAEYRKMVREGKLANKKKFDDDIQFEQDNPTHPLAYSMRSKRIRAAEGLREFAATNPDRITSEDLEVLHKAAFDCCATVRLIIVQAIGLLSQVQSLNHLQKLMEIEDESGSVKTASGEAILVINGELKINDGRYIRSNLVYA